MDAAGKAMDRARARAVALVHAGLLVGAVAVMALSADPARWTPPWLLLVIAVFAVVSDVTAVDTVVTKVKVSGSFLGIMLAAVLLGGAPASLVGVLTIGAGWFRWREPLHYLRNNLVTYMWFPLATGLFFHWIVGAGHVSPEHPAYYLLLFVTFGLALALNFLGAAGYQCVIEGSSLVHKVRDVLRPVLAAELFSALLTMAAVYVAVELGTVGLALFAVVLVVFQYLVGELLTSKRRGDELHRMATTDELTGLANREHFREHLELRIAAAQPNGPTFAVMLIDLDRFKEINDTLGHPYGDELLRELGPRLGTRMGPGGLVARLGGDEFAVLPPGPAHDIEALEEIAADLVACVEEPIELDEMKLQVGASIGIARFPKDGHDSHTLLRRADVAMYAAKDAKADWKLYAAELDRHSLRSLSVLGDFPRALEADEIVVHYQPIMDVDAARVRAAEGLVRWQHPELGLLTPGDFVHLVEQTSLIGRLTRHVLERSIAQCAAWRRDGHDLSVAVNLSARNLLDRELPRDIAHLLSIYRLPPEALQLEITESMIMSDPDRALATCVRLSELGVRLSVDDFGTGFFSLDNLRRLPIAELKIDRSFVSPMLRDESGLIIVRSTIHLGHDLGLKVIAEGVEDEATLERLAALGCDLAQGFHFSRPLDPEAFEAWMHELRGLRALASAA